MASTAGIGGKNQQRGRRRPASWRGSLTNRVAVQIGDRSTGASPSCGHEITEQRKSLFQHLQQLPKGRGFNLNFGEAGALAWNAEKFDVHG